MNERPLEEEKIFEFAASCARAYCKKYRAWGQYDDAVQEVAVFLLENRSLWSKPRAVLRQRAVGVLVRNYQNERRLRTKTPLRLITGTEFEKVDERRPEKEVDERLDSGVSTDPRLEIIERALRRPDVAPNADVIRMILSGRPRKEISAVFKLSQGRLSQIFDSFKRVCRQIELRNGSASVLVDTKKEDPTPEERAENPLFFVD